MGTDRPFSKRQGDQGRQAGDQRGESQPPSRESSQERLKKYTKFWKIACGLPEATLSDETKHSEANDQKENFLNDVTEHKAVVEGYMNCVVDLLLGERIKPSKMMDLIDVIKMQCDSKAHKKNRAIFDRVNRITSFACFASPMWYDSKAREKKRDIVSSQKLGEHKTDHLVESRAEALSLPDDQRFQAIMLPQDIKKIQDIFKSLPDDSQMYQMYKIIRNTWRWLDKQKLGEQENFVDGVAEKMREQGKKHDDSKFSKKERKRYEQETQALNQNDHNSKEHEEARKRLDKALKHHYENNRHHPEHFKEKGVNSMNLLDVTEMVCDWMAVTHRKEELEFSTILEENAKRFGISEPLYKLMENTAIALKQYRGEVKEQSEIRARELYEEKKSQVYKEKKAEQKSEKKIEPHQ